jgi:hypothetical protein
MEFDCRDRQEATDLSRLHLERQPKNGGPVIRLVDFPAPIPTLISADRQWAVWR